MYIGVDAHTAWALKGSVLSVQTSRAWRHSYISIKICAGRVTLIFKKNTVLIANRQLFFFLLNSPSLPPTYFWGRTYIIQFKKKCSQVPCSDVVRIRTGSRWHYWLLIKYSLMNHGQFVLFVICINTNNNKYIIL